MRRIVEMKEAEVERLNEINRMHEETVGVGQRAWPQSAGLHSVII